MGKRLGSLKGHLQNTAGQNAVFSQLIDTNNITGLDIGFDKAYYEQQAWQHLYTFYYSGNYYYTVYGGVEMTL
ncbi:hypothetical protein HYV83_00470 [Candidatus Woesearchaeota archaeon]|nr:hypothetical protein [Candidatus Woesearchaeota archaeon]